MDKDLKNILSEMKRLMNYNRSSLQYINEQGFGGSAGIVGTPQNFKQDKRVTDPKTSNFYKQKFKSYKGYFDNEMMLGECFDVVKFTTNDNAITSMDIPRNEIFKDEYGYYTKGKSLSFGGEARIYLPKYDFFKGLEGVVKSFTAYKTCNDQKKRQGGRKYTLVYQLVEPEKATALFTMDADGEKETSNDSSRGWQITNFAGSESGYFAEDTSQEPEGGWGQKSDNPKNNMLPQYFNEYSLQNYGEEYARSEFDIWYDSGWGITTVIAAQILLAIATAGIGNAISAAVGATGLASTAIVVGAELSLEFTIGLIEANYLFDRGYNTGAYMVLIFSLFPVFNRLGFIGKLSGRITEDEVARLLTQISKEAKSGKFKTPGDVKAWLKSLDDATRRSVEELLQKGSKALEKSNAKALTTDINKSLNKILNEIKTKGLTKETQTLITITTKEWPKLYGPTLKLIGIDLGVVVGSLPLFSKFVEDDEEIKRDPQGFMKKVGEGINRFKALVGFSNELEQKIKSKGDELMAKVSTNPNDTNAVTELINYLKDFAGTGSQTYNDIRTNAYKTLYNIVVAQMQYEYYEKRGDFDLKSYISIVDESYLLSPCQDLQQTPFKTKDEACKFLNWVNQTKKDTNGNSTFKYYVNINGKNIENIGVYTCDKRGENNSSLNLILNDCEIKNAWQQYGKEYIK